MDTNISNKSEASIKREDNKPYYSDEKYFNDNKSEHRRNNRKRKQDQSPNQRTSNNKAIFNRLSITTPTKNNWSVYTKRENDDEKNKFWKYYMPNQDYPLANNYPSFRKERNIGLSVPRMGEVDKNVKKTLLLKDESNSKSENDGNNISGNKPTMTALCVTPKIITVSSSENQEKADIATNERRETHNLPSKNNKECKASSDNDYAASLSSSGKVHSPIHSSYLKSFSSATTKPVENPMGMSSHSHFPVSDSSSLSSTSTSTSVECIPFNESSTYPSEFSNKKVVSTAETKSIKNYISDVECLEMGDTTENEDLLHTTPPDSSSDNNKTPIHIAGHDLRSKDVATKMHFSVSETDEVTTFTLSVPAASTMSTLTSSVCWGGPFDDNKKGTIPSAIKLQGPRFPGISCSTEIEQPTVVQVIPDRELARLCQVLLSRRSGVPREYSKGNSLVIRLTKLFSFPIDAVNDIEWLWKPLYDALRTGDEYLLNASIGPPPDNDGDNDHGTSSNTSFTCHSDEKKCNRKKLIPVLSWLCQWKYLKLNYNWEGNHDMVSLFLGAGADPNVESFSLFSSSTNDMTPIFFAVEYGCVETVKLLVKYGAKLTIKRNKTDSTKGRRSCLWNALNHPQPEIIRYLLQTLPIDERVFHRIHNKKICLGAVDYIFLNQFSLLFSSAPSHSECKEKKNKKCKEYPNSWHILGEPSEENVIETLIAFGAQGVSFTRNSLILCMLIALLQGQDFSSNKNTNLNPSNLANGRMKRLANFLIGKYLPPSRMSKREQFLPLLREEERMSGHQLDESNEGSPLHRNEKSLIEIDVIGWSGYSHSPLKALTYYQLLMECRSHGDQVLNAATLRCMEQIGNKDVLRNLLEGYMRDSQYKRREKFEFIPPNSINTTTKKLSLRPIITGAAVIPIVVQGISILAYLSMTSNVTLLSEDFVKFFGLQTKCFYEYDELTKNEARIAQKLVHELKFQLIGDVDTNEDGNNNNTVDVCLRNILQSSQLPNYIGIQLGLDFLRSGAWCVVDTVIENDNSKGGKQQQQQYVCLDGYGHTSISTVRNTEKSNNKKGEIRYYPSKDQNDDDDKGKLIRKNLLFLVPK